MKTTIESIRNNLTIIEAMQMVNKVKGLFYSGKDIQYIADEIQKDIDEYLTDQPDSEPKTYKVGDKVKIKSWDAMLKIGTPVHTPVESEPYTEKIDITFSNTTIFLNTMQFLCGTIQTINDINGDIIYFENYHNYYFTADMLE